MKKRQELKKYYIYNNTLIDLEKHRIEIGYVLPTEDGSLIGMYYIYGIESRGVHRNKLSCRPLPIYDIDSGEITEIYPLYNRVVRGKSNTLYAESEDKTVYNFLKEVADELSDIVGFEVKLEAVNNRIYREIQPRETR